MKASDGGILCTFPGRHGDLLWALPTIRAISEHHHTPVDLQICGEFEGLLPLLGRQPYLQTIIANGAWGMSQSWQPPTILGGAYNTIYHLGYREWPTRPLPEQTWLQARVLVGDTLPPLDLARPWITPPPAGLDFFPDPRLRKIAVGFTECWFELKVGLLHLVDQSNVGWRVQTCMGAGGRWGTELGEGECSWGEAATLISQAEVLLADCSALHVLGAALGIPVVVCEPMEARWNEIFYPLGKVGPQVTLVHGLDARPTFDARHVCEALEAVLATRAPR